MTPELEQLADEAIELRCTNTDRAISSYRIPTVTRAAPGVTGAQVIDHLDRARTVLAASWASHRPALAQLANERLAAISRLAEQGITPGPGCTVTVGRVTLEAVRDLHPVSHRYRVMRGREQAGWAWLSDTVRGVPYVVALNGDTTPDGYTAAGDSLSDALEWAARHLSQQPLTEAGAR